jgi:hypothetical protein
MDLLLKSRKACCRPICEKNRRLGLSFPLPEKISVFRTTEFVNYVRIESSKVRTVIHLFCQLVKLFNIDSRTCLKADPGHLT